MKMMTAMYTMRRGGAYDRFIMMIEAFLERGWEVHCLSLTPIQTGHPLFHNHTLNWPLDKIDSSSAKLFVLLIFPICAIWVGVKNRINLIVAFGVLYAFIQCFSKYILKKPMVTMIRGDSNSGLKMRKTSMPLLWINRKIDSLGLGFSDVIITNNHGLKEEILKKLKSGKQTDVKTLFNNIPTMPASDPQDAAFTRERYKINQNAKVLVTAGILHPGKNLEMLIGCLNNMGVENLHLILAGEGSTKADFSYKEFLKDLTKKLNVEDRVHFTGWLDKKDLWKIYQASDLFVLPSINEGMPNAMLEALGSGLPCIGSRIPGIIDILQYEELLFDPTHEEELVKKIQHIFCDPEHLDRIKGLCEERKRVFDFDWKERVFWFVTEKIRG